MANKTKIPAIEPPTMPAVLVPPELLFTTGFPVALGLAVFRAEPIVLDAEEKVVVCVTNPDTLEEILVSILSSSSLSSKPLVSHLVRLVHEKSSWTNPSLSCR